MSRDYTEITDEQLRALNKRTIEQPSYEQLREQNRVLTRYLEQARDSAKQVHDMAMKNVRPNPDTITMENVAIDHLEFLDRLLRAALTATSQEGQHG